MTFRQNITWFLNPIRSNKFAFLLTSLCGLIEGLGATYIVVFSKYVIDSLEKSNWELAKYRLYCRFIVISLRFLIKIFYKIFPFILFRDAHSYMYETVMSRYLKGNNTTIEKIGSGRVVSLIQRGLSAWMDLIGTFAWEGIAGFFTILFVFYQVFNENKNMGYIGIGIFFFSFLLVYGIYPYALVRRRKGKQVDTDIDRITILHIMNKFEIFQQNKISLEVGKIAIKNKEWFFYKVREKIRQGLSYDGVDYISKCILLYTAAYFTYGIFNHTSTIGEFVLFVGLARILGNQINEFIGLSRRFTDNYIHIEKLHDLLDKIYDPFHEENFTNKSFHYKQGNITLDNVTFGYEENKVFQNFSFKLQGGTKTAFVGESGGGKTTLIKLLAGYLRPDSGEIMIDGQKLSKVKLTDYYRHIGYLTQEPSVFDGTVWENLTYALDMDNAVIARNEAIHSKGKTQDIDCHVVVPPSRNDAQLEKKIHEIIKLAKCEFIYEFEDGLQTEIGERGVRLSGGQKQRLAIAKIMLKNSDIILLDEPTSALDSFNEEMVSEALTNLFKGKTVIVVAHRLQTVKNADRILYIEGGKVIEDGTHESLIKDNGRYKKMLDLQSGF